MFKLRQKTFYFLFLIQMIIVCQELIKCDVERTLLKVKFL